MKRVFTEAERWNFKGASDNCGAHKDEDWPRGWLEELPPLQLFEISSFSSLSKGLLRSQGEASKLDSGFRIAHLSLDWESSEKALGPSFEPGLCPGG